MVKKPKRVATRLLLSMGLRSLPFLLQAIIQNIRLHPVTGRKGAALDIGKTHPTG